MNLDEFDNALPAGDGRPRLVNENLLALNAEPTCRLLETATLDERLGNGRWRVAGVGLERWLVATGECLTRRKTAHDSAAEAMATRDQLAGLMIARRAQIQRLIVRGARIDPDLDRRAHELELLLRRRPTPLAEAQRAVEAFEIDLRRAPRKAGG